MLPRVKKIISYVRDNKSYVLRLIKSYVRDIFSHVAAIRFRSRETDAQANSK